MSGLLGAFVLILVGVLGVQLELASSLEAEKQKRQQEEQRRVTLEKALAGPLASGRVTLDNGRIGISGSVLFALNSDGFQPRRPAGAEEPRCAARRLSGHPRRDPDGERLHRRPPGTRQQPQVRRQLVSAQRALTVTRAMIEEGVPAASIFAAAFGPGAARRLQRRRRRPRPQPPRRDGASAALRQGRRRRQMSPAPANDPAATSPPCAAGAAQIDPVRLRYLEAPPAEAATRRATPASPRCWPTTPPA